MPLFLVTSVMDEGVYGDSFVLVEAASKLEIAQQMLDQPRRWAVFLQHAYPTVEDQADFSNLLDRICREPLTATDLLHLIAQTRVDGGSCSQLRIYATTATPLSAVQVKVGWVEDRD